MRPLLSAAVALSWASALAFAQPAADRPAREDAEPGIPIASEAVKNACGTCHAADAKGCLTRISYRRTTPEGWQETIKRMATLNAAPLEPAVAREVVRYLANELGLAPEEAQPAAFEVERRLVEYEYPDQDAQRACGACHSIGRAMLQRRTGEEWELLVAMHRGYYPLVDFQAFRNLVPPPTEPGPDGRPPDRRHPVEKALAHLKAAFPLRTPEWAAWSATKRPPRLAGRFGLSASAPGQGPVFGELTITAKPESDAEFTTVARYAAVRGGPAVVRHGQAIVYTGFQWRGRSTTASGDKDELREVMFVERDGRSLVGRWFAGRHDESGLDVKLSRLGSDAVVLGMSPFALRAGEAATVRVYGFNLGHSVGPREVDFGPGVSVKRVSEAEGGLALDLEVAREAPVGIRDLSVAGATCARAAVVFSSVDGLKVTPPAGLARVGGIQFPKRLQQFEARALSNGPDGKPDTKDDLDLGPAEAEWSIEEFTATFGDDDKDWVGHIDASGLFTPAEDGPNPKRLGNRNNVGDVFVVATLPTTSPLRPAAPLRARAHLIVTVPLYVRWDQPEVLP